MRTTRQAIPFRSYKPKNKNSKISAETIQEYNKMKAKIALII